MRTLDVVAWEGGRIKLIDQTKLPLRFEYIYVDSVKKLWHAIKVLKVRGAPAIGIAGAFGVALAAQKFNKKSKDAFLTHIENTISYLSGSRPTAVNLFWAFERMRSVMLNNMDMSLEKLKARLLKEANDILDEDKKICRKIGSYGAGLLKNYDTVLTHCNAGGLATGDYGTALGVLYSAVDKGKHIRVFVDETRPLLQGARLSAWELMQYKIDVTLICDNMAASVMQKGWIDKIIVGADRIAANGDTANKIGTYNLGVLAKHHNIPLYIAAPLSTFDFSIKDGGAIPIETRDEKEVCEPFGRRIAPVGVKVYNPAFDVTPHNLIAGFITEYGVFKSSELGKLRADT